MFEDSTHGGRRVTSTSSKPFLDISTHALIEGDLIISFIHVCLAFQLTPSGGRLQKPDGCMSRTYFNSRRATPPPRAVSSLLSYFNSRPHKGRRYDTSVCRVSQHFNSCTHRGRLASARLISDFILISTHALTEGDQSRYISTHALTEGDDVS